MPEVFHRRGHHVQKAHGRRQFAADGSHLSGGMIALLPSAEDAKRLALPGGEKAADLHCTLVFLGDDGAAWPPDVRDIMEGFARRAADGMTPIKAKVFGAAHWNGGGENPSWVWNVGDDPAQELADSSLNEAYSVVGDIIGATMAAALEEMPEIPPQHSPWAAHICAAYTDDLTLVRALEKRNGPVVFDRIRLSFGDDDRDIPLTARGVSLVAAGLRRDAHEHEGFCDFAEHNRQWEGAVAAATNRLGLVMGEWRAALREQLAAGLDDPETLSSMTLDPSAAADVLSEAMLGLAERAGQALVREAAQQGVEIPEWSLPDDTVTAAVGGRRLLRSVAEATSGLLAGGLVQRAKRLAVGLLTRQTDPQQLAAEVDRTLQEDQESALRGPVGTAMSTAQTAGRQAVLEAAPPGEYYASEILDKNTCGPCKAVDGEQFSSLEIAIKAYPVMGYKDCVGPKYGNSCRGMIVARWTPEEPEAMVAHGTPGRPSYRRYHPSGRNLKQRGKTQHARGGMIGSDRFSEAEHEDALLNYIGRAYRDVNAHLRSETPPKRNTLDEVRSVTSTLTDLIAVQPPSTGERTVYRGTRQLRLGLRPGDEFHDRGFMSTSDDRSVADSMTGVGGSLFIIKAPAGTQALDVRDLGADASEAEILYPPGTKMRVVSADEPEDELKTAVYTVEIVNG